MLWYQHGDEHIHVLLNYAQQQRELHQAETFQRETERVQAMAYHCIPVRV